MFTAEIKQFLHFVMVTQKVKKFITIIVFHECIIGRETLVWV